MQHQRQPPRLLVPPGNVAVDVLQVPIAPRDQTVVMVVEQLLRTVGRCDDDAALLETIGSQERLNQILPGTMRFIVNGCSFSINRCRHAVGLADQEAWQQTSFGGKLFTEHKIDLVRLDQPQAGQVRAVQANRRTTGSVDNTGVLAKRLKRSEEHTSELQSLRHLVCRLLL